MTKTINAGEWTIIIEPQRSHGHWGESTTRWQWVIKHNEDSVCIDGDLIGDDTYKKAKKRAIAAGKKHLVGFKTLSRKT